MTEEGVDSDEDLTKELQPLAYHVSDRRRVLREALKTLKGKRLEAMIPPVLKAWNRPKLESACISILEDLDDETLLAILDGRAASSGVSTVEQQAPAKSKSKLKKIKDSDAEVVLETPKKKRKKSVAVAEEKDGKATKIKKKKLAKAKLKEKKKKKKKAAAASEAGSAAAVPPAPHKSLMELLELEYRAKAIKALLRSQGQVVPDIPINLDEEDSEEGQSAQPDTANTSVITNGAENPEMKVADICKNVDDGQKELKVVSSTKAKKSVSARAVLQTKPKTSPKKAVIDLIDEALNTNIAQDTGPHSTRSNAVPSSVIVDACAIQPCGSEQSLRSKLIKKYQQKTEAEYKPDEPKPVTTKTKKKKRKNIEEFKEPEEDILDLHPQELSLTDDDRAISQQNTENETSDNETTSDEELEDEKMEENVLKTGIIESSQVSSEKLDAINPELSPDSKKTHDLLGISQKEEELIYDDDDEKSEKEEQTGDCPQKDSSPAIDDNDDKDNSKDSEEEENDLWKDVQEVGKDEGSNDNDDNMELLITDEDKNETEIMDKESVDGVINEGERIPVKSRSETSSRDNVFEAFSDSKLATASGSKTSVATGRSLLQRKITLRIDPARIGALKAKAAEEDALKAEERRRQEEEERLANEVEEGEIDSHEEENITDKESRGDIKSPTPMDVDLRTKLNNKRKAARQMSSSPMRKIKERRSNKDNSHSSDSDDTSYYSKRKETYRKSSSPKRDFGRYSPTRLTSPTSQTNENQSTLVAEKRASSPVEFITQFSDMEPISTDDSQNSQSFISRKSSQPTKKLVVQSCEEEKSKPSPEVAEEIEKAQDEAADQDKVIGETTRETKDSEESENEEDELPKPITWYERWAESHGMKKVVQTNIIHKKVRTKLKKATASSTHKKQPVLPTVPEPSIEAEPIIGSIEEYEKLFGKKVIVKQASDDKSNEVDGSEENKEDDNDDDDGGDDDLWGDIMGGS